MKLLTHSLLLTMLTEVQIRSLKPKDKLYRKADAHGLCLEVRPNGKKFWRFRYRFKGKANMLSLGSYEFVSLKEARIKHSKARELLYEGINPTTEFSKKDTQKNTEDTQERKVSFKYAANAWLTHRSDQVVYASYQRSTTIVTKDLIPALGSIDVEELITADCIPVILAIQERAPSMAKRAREHLNKIIRFAIQHGWREDGRLLDLHGILARRDKSHIPAAVNEHDLNAVIQAISDIKASTVGKALWLCAWTVMRPAIVASAQWKHIDLEAKTWHVPGKLMKTGNDHRVPLPSQAIQMLSDIKQTSDYVFVSPSQQTRQHIHRDSMSRRLRQLGFQGQHATHGFRSSFRTLAREKFRADVDVLEAQLAHTKRGQVAQAYDRAWFDEERKELMQQWADYLDELKA